MSPPDLGALSGPVAGVSFIAGVAGAMALADLPHPRPGSDAAQIRRYFTQNAGPAAFDWLGSLRQGRQRARQVHEPQQDVGGAV
jgi:hypothetical protein